MPLSPLPHRQPRWPCIFQHPRQFDRESENKSYLDYLKDLGHYFTGSDSESDGTAQSDCDEEGGDEEDADEENADEEDSGPEAELPSAVRRFVRGTGVENRVDPHLDAVVKFVEHSIHSSKHDVERELPLIAIVDDRRNDANARGPVHRPGKPHHGGLTKAQLTEVLNTPRPHPTHDLMLQDRYLPDLDATGIEVLASTAPSSQREALLTLFRHHVKLSPSIGVALAIRGFQTFVLHIHLPFFALRNHRELCRDMRQNSDGKPLRNSWALDCLPTSSRYSSSDTKWCLYEAQTSVTLIGIEDCIWTAYGIMDTYFDPRSGPEAAGHAFYRDARGYFLMVVEARAYQIGEEFDLLFNVIEETISRRTYLRHSNYHFLASRRDIRDFVNT
ncbi:hypothetical protein B0H67DRAFT_558349 [Lasiosphaeris hirsuta]|uniref:Uncharacterized protein n=1 Tax=Lasiosphaeris hirsuta TaxID=260670 RepID=A0AA39ZS85_9PEZI|nr:hypothetical protein B0H67DRAFT_558349 [Lasiosphaeris hirsuta]